MAISKLRKVVVSAVMAVSALLASEGSAQATWFTYDEFENIPSGWYFDGSGSHNGTFVTSTYYSPTRSAKLTTSSGGWSAVGRGLEVGLTGVCEVEFMVKVGSSSTSSTMPVTVEVIDPASWTYISLRTISVTKGSWALVVGNAWNGYDGQDVYVRLSIGGSGTRTAYVDDQYIWCD
jgi:hypothetical protein